MSIESVIPSNQLILCRPLFLPPSIFPSIRVFSNESALCIRWPKYWSFNFSISPSNEHPGLIFFRMDWLDLLQSKGSEDILKRPASFHTETSIKTAKKGTSLVVQRMGIWPPTQETQVPPLVQEDSTHWGATKPMNHNSWPGCGACEPQQLSSHAPAKALQSCLAPADPTDHSLPGSCVHGLLQARTREWGAVPSSRGSSWPGHQAHLSRLLCSLLSPHWAAMTEVGHREPLLHNKRSPPHRDWRKPACNKDNSAQPKVNN